MISKALISNIVNKKGEKKRQIGASCGTKIPNKYSRKKWTALTVTKNHCLMLKEKSLSQRTVAKSFKCSVSTVNKMINVDLNLKKVNNAMCIIFLQSISLNTGHAAEFYMKNAYPKKNGKNCHNR